VVLGIEKCSRVKNLQSIDMGLEYATHMAMKLQELQQQAGWQI
jgi:hypothetical protein